MKDLVGDHEKTELLAFQQHQHSSVPLFLRYCMTVCSESYWNGFMDANAKQSNSNTESINPKSTCDFYTTFLLKSINSLHEERKNQSTEKL